FFEVTIQDLLSNTTITIRVHGFEGNPLFCTGGKVFVTVHCSIQTYASTWPKIPSIIFRVMMLDPQSIKTNSTHWKSNCFTEWDVFEQGSIIDLVMADDRTMPCGSQAGALPPSISTGGHNWHF